jgi:hypothetical protein
MLHALRRVTAAGAAAMRSSVPSTAPACFQALDNKELICYSDNTEVT